MRGFRNTVKTLSIVLLIWSVGGLNAQTDGGELAKAPMSVEAIRAVRGKIAKELEYFGTIAGYKEAQVYPDMPGKLLEYTVREGDRVKKDQVIAKIERSIPGLEYKPLLVKSPIDGVVGLLYLKPGQMVAPQVPLAFISNTDSLDCIVEVSELDLMKIKVGQEAEVSLDSIKTYKGKVYRISSAVNPMSRMGTVRVRILEDAPDLKPGMLARVRIQIKTVESAVKVPLRAVVKEKDKTFVFVVENGVARKREVLTGITSRGWVEIKEGLEEGEVVVTLGAAGLVDGERVRIRGEIK